MGRFAEELELAELMMRIYSDTEPPKVADAVYLFGQTEYNEESVLSAAAALFKSGKVRIVVIGEGGCLVTGEIYKTPDWRGKLIKLGVPKERITTIQITSELAHTHTEAIAFVSHAKREGWKTMYVTSPAIHQLRAFVNTVSIVLQEYPELKVFNKVGTFLSWVEEAVHSQNIEKGKRYELVENEWRRVLRYHEKGDLVSAREVLSYLNRRDS